MTQTVIGIFDKASDAQSAVEGLKNGGFDRYTIDLSTRNSDYNRDTDDDDSDNEGGISGFFSSLFGSDDDDRNKRYTTVGQRGSIVTVHADSANMADRAADILDACGAVDIDEKATEYDQSSTQSYAAATPPVTADPAGGVTGYANTAHVNTDGPINGADQVTDVVRNGETLVVPILDESLRVGKQTVETGGVRVRSRIIERPVDETVRLRTERVVVQRNPVNRVATDADFNTFQEGEIELTEHAERAVVAKEARVIEEVTVGKTVDEHDEIIRDTVRRTDVQVEEFEPTNQTSETIAPNTK